MRALLLLLTALSLAGCQIVYKLPTRQGNVLEQADLDKLRLGMTREQVKFLLGTPVASSPFREDRWDYLGYYKPPRGDVTSRLVSIYFAEGKVARMDNVTPTTGETAVGTPDVKTLMKQDKKDKSDDERAAEPHETGVILSQPSP